MDICSENNSKEENILQDITCSICTNLFIQPFSISCGHTFCKTCITRWIKQRKICPICNSKIIKLPEKENVIIKSIVERCNKGNQNQNQNQNQNNTDVAIDKLGNNCLCDKCTEKILSMSSLNSNEDFSILIKKNKDLLCSECNNTIISNNTSIEIFNKEEYYNDDTLDLSENEIQMIMDSNDNNKQQQSLPLLLPTFQYTPDFPDSDDDGDDINIIESEISQYRQKRNKFSNGKKRKNLQRRISNYCRTETTIPRKTIENSKRKSWCDNNNMCSACKNYIKYMLNPNKFKNPKHPCINRPQKKSKKK